MKALEIILIIVLAIIAIKFGWRLIKYIWKWAGSIILAIGFIVLLTSDKFLDVYYADNKFLKKHGYEMGSEGVKQFAKDVYEDRQEYIDGFKEIGRAIEDSLIIRIVEAKNDTTYIK